MTTPLARSIAQRIRATGPITLAEALSGSLDDLRSHLQGITDGEHAGVALAEVTLESLHAPGNATHVFMDFMLMMGVAGEGQVAAHADSLDLFHTMEAYFTWYPQGTPDGGPA